MPANNKLHTLKNHVIYCRDFLLDILFPLSCYGCQTENSFLCPQCLGKIFINDKLKCPLCKKINNLGSFCSSCQTKNEIDGLWISADYHDALLADIIKAFKYSFNKNLAEALGDLLIAHIAKNEIDKKCDDFNNCIAIPVPLHKSRLRYRGFNQAELLSAHLAKHFNIPMNAAQLKRQKKTKAQAKLTRDERLKNVVGAFEWEGISLDEQKVILVDDVTTTNSTLNACAQVLKKHGAKEVWGLVLATN